MILLASAIALIVFGGLAASIVSRFPGLSSAFAVAGVVAGAVLGETCALRVLLHGEGAEVALAWPIPFGEVRIGLDALSAFFLVPVFALAAPAAVYGRGYLRAYHGKKRVGIAWLSFNLLVASMVVVVASRQALLFLVAWELMSLSAYVLITFEHEKEDVRRAGFVYLIATHVGMAFLVAMFLIFGRHAGGFAFSAMQSHELSSGQAALLFALALVGFGVKAGLVPLHVWLPEAHAAAPSHVSALMSGVLIKMGIYGLLRMIVLLGRPAVWFGPLLMAIGLAGGLLGISLALYQRDIKRVLAYSSIENVGLIVLGIGTGLWGRSSGRPDVAALGMSGALLHVWNHTLMKGLMFLAAGSVVHASGTKDLEQLGGVVKRMPLTAGVMVLGAVAIAALPPMNGFVSEWLLYLGVIGGALSSGRATGVAAFMAVGLVSLVGGLAVLCFVRVVGIALLGEPRSESAARAHESPAGMTFPMILLAAMCASIGLAPGALFAATLPATAELVGVVAHAPATEASLDAIGWFNAGLWLLLGAGAMMLLVLNRRGEVAARRTWDCGYALPSPRMQYTSRSFAELVSQRLLPKSLRAHLSFVAPSKLFPGPVAFSSECSDPLTRGFYEPFIERWGNRFARLRWLQQGVLHVYLVYILFTALFALAWASLHAWMGR